MLALLLLVLAGCGDQPGTRADVSVPFDLEFELHERLAIGDEDTFGKIGDVIADERGHTYVLDTYFKKVDRFDESGMHLASVDKQGKGPGELDFPSALAFWGEANLYVFDPGNIRLLAFATDNGALNFIKQVRLAFPGGDMCTLGDRVFVMGLLEGHLVHELSSEGEVVASFGEPESGDAIIQEISGVGHLLCDEATATILTVPLSFPQVRAFSPSGEVRWAVELGDYHQIVYERSGGGIRPRFDASGKAHGAVGVVSPGPGIALVQLEVHSAGAPREETELDSRFLSLATGTEIARRSDLPRVVYVKDSVAYASVEDPYPRVLVFDMESPRPR